MSYLEQVQRGVDFIEARLDDDIDLRDVSRAAGISHWHFQRIFKALTGETLKTYVRSRRMANALDLLLTSKLRILDIAVAAGFDSQEAFARAFKRTFGLTPTEYRKIGDRSLFLKKLRLDEDYLSHVSSAVSLEPFLEERSSMRTVGMRTTFYGPESEKNNIGEALPALWDRFTPRAHEVLATVPMPYYGVVQQQGSDPERLEYYACRPATESAPVPDDMYEFEVPAATYAIFEHRGPAKNVDQTVSYVYSTWLLGSSYRHTYGPDLEIYDEQWHPTSAESVMYYGIPVTVG